MRERFRNFTPDLLVFLWLFLAPLIMFWGQTIGGGTLLPAENLYQYAPYAGYVDELNVPPPHNALLSDMVLQNLQWKAFIKDSIQQGEVPLWNPHQISGVPFMAAGQPSTLYPLNLIYYLLPLPTAYGWFVVVNLWLAGVMLYAYLRALKTQRAAATIGAITYQMSGFFIASAVFPMMLGGVVWLPLLLLMTEYILNERPIFGKPTVTPWIVIGAGALGLNILAGHVEITYYTILIVAYYGAFRLLHGYLSERTQPRAAQRWLVKLGSMAALGILGLAIGAIQFVPLVELVNTNWRASGKTFTETLGFAHPIRDVLQFVMPNFYGSPAQHTALDVFDWTRNPIDFTNALGFRKTDTDWGMKNYVEGALYVGILPLVLAAYALFTRRKTDAPYRSIYASLGVLSLTFMFGLPTYALIYYALPGMNQSHTPFRWVYALTLSVAVLAALGFDRLTQSERPRLKQIIFGLLALVGIGTLAALGISYAAYPQLEPYITQALNSLARANEAFPDARAFYSHLFLNALTFGLITLMSALVWGLFTWGKWGRIGAALAVLLVTGDLINATYGFNPNSDPDLLSFTPRAIEWLAEQDGYFRYITLDDPTQPPLFQANMTWRYGLDDVRGYESIIPKHYVDYMRQLAPQVQLDFNRIAPLYTTYPAGIDFDYRDALTSPRLHLLNVRYVITHANTDISDTDGYTLVYEDAQENVRIWENANAMPRAFASPDPICHTPVENPDELRLPNFPTAVTIEHDSGREIIVSGITADPANLILLNSYFDGWRAYRQYEREDGTVEEVRLDVFPAFDNFLGVTLEDVGTYRVRFVYSPTSVQLGGFITAISGLVGLFMLGVWFWKRFVIDKDTEGKALLARNSIAPVLLNLFNRAIDFVLAFVVLRILGPEDTGIYYYAVIVFVWFDIFTNFGLDVFLTREVSRDKSKAGYLFVNTTAFRLLLSLIGVGLLLLFIFARQNTTADPFETRGIIALVLLYLGLLPGSLSKGMTSLYYAYERAEYPAAVSTVTTVNKAVFQIAVLLAGWGIIGMAAVSIANNFITLAILLWAGRDMLGNLRGIRPDAKLTRGMARESYPLMLNHFLATIFFQIDVVILEAMRGAAIVGKYSVGYRWLLALNVIPAFFTMAFFPRMSRHAQDDREALRRNYVLSLKLLAALVFPAAVLLTFLARPLTLLLGGREFLPEGALALQIMVWSMPLGWMNSLTQYLLIALDRQRQLTWAFIVGVTFNIVTNLIFIPIYSYQAAAVTTILSELILMIGFGVLLRQDMRGVNWARVLAHPAAASIVMVGAIVLGNNMHPIFGILFGVIVYPLAWVALRPFSTEEWNIITPMLPAPIRQRLTPATN